MIYCFDIGGSYISLGTASTDVAVTGALTRVGRVPTPARDRAAFVQALASLIDQAPGPEDAPVALALAGDIDPATGLASCANIPCLTGTPLVADLTAALGRPVVVGNDAACFVLAEATVGAARGQDTVFGIILGTGVGGGLVVGGQLVPGAGEWGHGPVVKQVAGAPPITLARLPCGCGQAGCVDTIGGARGLERLHHALHGVRLDSQALTAAWHAGDRDATRTMDIYVDLVADPLAVVVNAVGAGLVPVGGGLSSDAALVSALDQAVRARILRRTGTPLLVPTALGGAAGMLGAAILGARWLERNRA
ncbi:MULTISPECIES: ROK family protein [Nitrospirillum]|uniref:N-acetylglucosamine kinase n=1 Tax=Nitrospirillum amazonense TaxID=28077 RepID=A0A560FZE4_9PROT|nr:ROK family protein [Nitrospirillum amazonense]MEC4592473.1 ROK family protein [Nitrospirillum amazonense]TWB26850.1 N-acetylglucosamine kinase [Nitrospirillum amazonense]